MRRLFVTLFAISMLGLGGALAQVTTAEPFDDDVDLSSQYWGGLSVGLPFGVNFHFGAEDMLSEGVDFRGTLSAGFSGVFGIGADVLFDLPVDTDTAPVDVYAGAGLALGFGEIDGNPGTDTSFGLGFMVGGEYRLVDAGMPEGGVFAEVGPGIGFGAASGVAVNAKLGFNYHF